MECPLPRPGKPDPTGFVAAAVLIASLMVVGSQEDRECLDSHSESECSPGIWHLSP